MLTKSELISNIPLDTILRIKAIVDGVDVKNDNIVERYNQLRKYDDKLRNNESVTAAEVYDIVDTMLLSKISFNTEVDEWRYECILRIVLSLMIYGSINITIDELTKDEFIAIRTSLRQWYKQFKRVSKCSQK